MSSIALLRKKQESRAIHQARSAKFVVVTPEIAEEWLEKNTHNRPTNAAHVTKLVRDLRNARWMVNGETIKFDWNGTLLDGQHRLYAIIEAGESAECLVVYGLDPESFQTIDGGAKRSNAHHFALMGKSEYNTLAGAISNLRRYERGHLNSGGADRYVSGPEAIETLMRYPDIEDSVPVARRARNVLASSYGAFFHYVFSAKDPGLADDFFEKLATGAGCKDTDAVLHLRERLIRDRMDKKSAMDGRYLRALVIKAWNKTVAGEECKALRWDPEREAFPEIE